MRGRCQTLQKLGPNIQTLPTKEVLTCFKCIAKTSFSGPCPFSWDGRYPQETQTASCVWGRAAVLQAGQRTGSPLPELPGFRPSCIAVAATRPNSLAASILLSSVFAGGRSLAPRSDRPVKSHTLGVNLTPWVFASMPPAATAGSCAFPEPFPVPGLSAVDVTAWLCLGATIKLHHVQGLEEWQASEELVLLLVYGFPERHVFPKDKDLAGF